VGLVLITPPAEEPVPLGEALNFLKLDGADDGDVVAAILAAARQQLEGRGGWLGRALVTQTWDYTLDRFPEERRPHEDWPRNVAIRVPLPPLQSVTFVKYVDLAGVEQVLDPAKYVVTTTEEPGLITPAYQQIWPYPRQQAAAVTVRFVAGYGDTAETVPEIIRLAVKLLAAHFYENRGDAPVEVPDHVRALLVNEIRSW